MSTEMVQPEPGGRAHDGKGFHIHALWGPHPAKKDTTKAGEGKKGLSRRHHKTLAHWTDNTVGYALPFIIFGHILHLGHVPINAKPLINKGENREVSLIFPKILS